ncbi:glucokinase [Candidatus Dojkabacteria bacterium]|nr:glucokinase [Candidatus Dojkabacteria bacterium]
MSESEHCPWFELAQVQFPPAYYGEQRETFEGAQFPVSFNKMQEGLRKVIGQNGVAINIGGTNLNARRILNLASGLKVLRYEGVWAVNLEKGATEAAYIEALRLIQGRNCPVCITVAGPLEGTTWFPTNLPELRAELGSANGGVDLREFFGENLRIAVNDAVAAQAAAMYYLLSNVSLIDSFDLKRDRLDCSLLLQIVGTGNGFSYIVLGRDGEGYIMPTEWGHAETGWLDMYGTAIPTSVSRMINSGQPALESLIAGPGIARLFQKLTGLEGYTSKRIALEILGKASIELASQLGCTIGEAERISWAADEVFKVSALGAAQQFIGVIKHRNLDPGRAILVGRGGVWNAPGYLDLVKVQVESYFGVERIPFFNVEKVDSEADFRGAVLLWAMGEAANR